MTKKLTEFLKRKELLIPLFLSTISFIIGLVSLHLFHFIGSDGGGDGVVYAISGMNLFSGRGFSFHGGPQLIHPPLYPILIGIFWLLTHNLEFSGQMVSIIATALLVIPLYYLAKNMYGRRIGFLTAVFAIVCPPLVFASTEVRCESLYALLMVGSISLGWKALHSKNLLWALLTGLVIGLAFLTHPIGLIFAPIFVFLFLLSKFFSSRLSSKLVLMKIAALLASFVLVSMPYWIFLHKHTGRWVLSAHASYIEFARVKSLSGDSEKDTFILFREPEHLRYTGNESSQTQEGMLRYVVSHPGRVVGTIYKNLSMVYPRIAKDAAHLKIPPSILKASLLFVFLLILIGLVRSIWKRRLTSKELYLAIMLSSAAVFLIFHIEARYFFPYLPIIILGMAKLTIDFQDWINEKFHDFNRAFRQVLGWFLPLVLFLGMSVSSTIIIVKKENLAPYEYKILGQWMRQNIENIEDKVVMLRKLGTSFYAGSKWDALYYGDYPGLLEYAKSRGVDYLVIDEYAIPRSRPQFAFLLNYEDKHPGLESVHIEEYRGRKIILYRVKGDS
ncbi:glycosyltransferase family 39 protein [Candidatus Aerophobetes bacterium]|uniref:Glycosyltransferase family 39 protein n=1 Tax=Aerophobetes bacterium TaxID=2030807 RepID=A0A523RPY7_UNCAE|nr:MAG: glycosyltransferase family 39 protein [Candidatus Aerophobetes bacterium]